MRLIATSGWAASYSVIRPSRPKPPQTAIEILVWFAGATDAEGEALESFPPNRPQALSERTDANPRTVARRKRGRSLCTVSPSRHGKIAEGGDMPATLAAH